MLTESISSCFRVDINVVKSWINFYNTALTSLIFRKPKKKGTTPLNSLNVMYCFSKRQHAYVRLSCDWILDQFAWAGLSKWSIPASLSSGRQMRKNDKGQNAIDIPDFLCPKHHHINSCEESATPDWLNNSPSLCCTVTHCVTIAWFPHIYWLISRLTWTVGPQLTFSL